MEHDSRHAPAAVRWLARAEITVVGTILLTSLLITLYSILARNFGHSTGDWTLKLPELLLVWMTFLGMGALVTERSHVAADMVLSLFSPRWQRIAQTASALITSVVLGLILFGAASIVRMQLDIGATDDELFGLPLAVILGGLPLFLAITIVHLLVDIYAIWRPAPESAA
jgi:TRAP-type C4-dicarboxylate transport system permease small subunit